MRGGWFRNCTSSIRFIVCSIDPVFLVYSVKPAEEPKITSMIPHCRAECCGLLLPPSLLVGLLVSIMGIVLRVRVAL